MNKTRTFVSIALASVLICTLPAFAQRGGDRGGRDRGGRGGGGDFRARILERIDQNGNGIIEPNEAQGRAAGFIERMARDAGMEPGQPLPIRRLTGESRGDERRDQGSRDRNNSQKEEDDDEFPTIPRFGEEAVAGFGLSPLTLAGKIVNLEKKYDGRVLENVGRTMERYDKNKNGILDHSEWSSVPWRSDPRDSDLDKDGILTKAEMADRFAKRESRSRDERDRGDRGRGDRGRGDRGRGDRERGEEGRGRTDGDRGRGGFGSRGGLRGGFDPTIFISRMDKNGNGKIDPDEVDERGRRWVEERFKVDLSKSVSIDSIRQKVQEARGGGGDSSRSGGGGEGAKKEEEETQEAYRVDGKSRLKGRLSYRSQGRSLPKQLPDWWEDRDDDEDGQITMNEFSSSRSDSVIREFEDYDSNGDGLISTREAESLEKD